MSFFEHIFGGMPGGHGFPGQEKEDKEPVDTEEFYKRLEVSKSATQEEIKRAYKKKARKLHPDRHPNEKDKYRNLFQEAQEAYEVLSDKHKRKLYDQGGMEAVKRGKQTKGRSHPFGGLFGERDTGGKKKSPPIKRQLEVSLEDLYRGSTRQISIVRKSGEKGSTACTSCDGRGEITIMQRMGPVMFQQRRACNKCEGQGYMLTETSAQVEFHIPVGGRHGEKVTIPGEGHKYPQHEPGDVIIQLVQKKHKLFTRQGADLGFNYELTLVEALCGYEIKVPHVSGTVLSVHPKLDEDVKKFKPVNPGDLKVVYTQGMPQRFNTHVRGNLFIQMEVKLPIFKSMSNKQLNQLKQILPNTETNVDIKEELSGVSQSNSKDDNNNNNNNNNNRESQLKGFFNNSKKNKNKKNKKNKNKKKNSFDDEIVEEVECEDVEGKPHATPATARGVYDEDDGRQEVECHQM